MCVPSILLPQYNQSQEHDQMSSNSEFVDILRGFLSHDGVVGGKDRWWTNKKEFDFLCDGDDEERVSRLLIDY
jgi:hypothetical protein